MRHAGYTRWASSQDWTKPYTNPPYLERRYSDGCIVDVLHRDGPYQTERVCFQKGLVKMHRHPGVSSYEYGIQGDGFIQVGSRVFPGVQRKLLPLPSYAWHGGWCTQDNTVFLSIQHWTNGVTPTSVLEVWEGPTDYWESA